MSDYNDFVPMDDVDQREAELDFGKPTLAERIKQELDVMFPDFEDDSQTSTYWATGTATNGEHYSFQVRGSGKTPMERRISAKKAFIREVYYHGNWSRQIGYQGLKEEDYDKYVSGEVKLDLVK